MYCASAGSLQGQDAPAVQIGVGRAHRIGRRLNRAGTESQVHARIEATQSPQAIRVATQIADRRAPVGADLPFER